MTAAIKEVVQAVQLERRGKPRTSVPSITLRIDGKSYVPDDWGLKGCRIPGYQGPLRPGDQTGLDLFLNVDHDHDGLAIHGRVVRSEASNNTLAIEFFDLSAQDIIAFCDVVDAKLGAELHHD